MKNSTRPTAAIPDDRLAEELTQFETHGTGFVAQGESSSVGPARPVAGSIEESSASDAYLVAECLKGNEQAWAALIDKYKRLVFSIPIKYGASSTEAAEILQSVCVELFCELSKLRKAESVKAWLVVVTSRKYFQWRRERSAELALDDVEAEHPEAIAVRGPEIAEAEKEQFLREGIAELGPRCRELVQLLFYEDPPLPYTEVARRLGLATGSIGFIRGRCLDRLRKLLLDKGF